MQRKFFLIFLFLSTGLIIGCATPTRISFMPTGTAKPGLISQSVEFLYEKPKQEYEVIGKLIVEPRREWFIWENSASVTEEHLQELMREKAKNVGADAVIIEVVSPYVSKTGLWSSTIHRMEGLAIRWKK